jgi:penicillin-binding protein 1A
MKLGKIIAILIALGFVGAIGVAVLLVSVSSSLPKMIKVEDYKPLLVTEVYARGGEKIGEFFRENRTLVPYEKMPKHLVQAFVAAEDDTFFEHGGVNYLAILRAFLINLTSGEKRQGASTITQQVARSLLLSSEKTYTRKIKEILLAHKMEANLKKEEILYLYLNQIYFGEGAYGVAAAADMYFRKTVDQLTLPEMAILAGLPQAPSSYSPSDHPQKAKSRQKYVLERMAKVGFIKPEEAQQAIATPVTVYLGKEYKQVAPYFVETLRQLLVQQLGEKAVLDEGLRVYTSVDFKAQQEATANVQAGLKELDKRQGFRGPLRHLSTDQEDEQFLLATRKKLIAERAPIRTIKPDGNVEPERPLIVYHKRDAQGRFISNIPDYITKGQVVEALVTKVDDKLGLTTVRFAEGLGLIDISEMSWARKPDSTINAAYAPKLTKPSLALKPGDIILVKVIGDKFSSQRLAKESLARKKGAATEAIPNFEEHAHVSLDQNPTVQGSLLSFDQKTGEVIAMVGGYEFIRNKNEFNRTLQAKRQTGSSFKTVVYTSALDKGFTPATPIQDAPVVFETKEDDKDGKDSKGNDEAEEGQEDVKVWKPHNHEQKFTGDLLFRTALVRSLNIPAVKILEKVGVPWVMDYARRLGVFSPLNADLSLALGSSSITLYEMTKIFSNIGRLGHRIRPVVIHKVLDKDGKAVLGEVSLDKRFDKEITDLDTQFETRRKEYLAALAKATPTPNGAPEADPSKNKVPKIFFDDPDQLVSQQTAYLMTTLLSAVVNDPGGTGGRAREMGRPVAGKTGTTNGYIDGWFVGFTPQVVTGVWVGFDEEKTLGPGEVGGRAALPIWLDFMKAVHKDLPAQDFPVPPGIVFANIDGQTGNLASASSASVVRQAFLQGTEPAQSNGGPSKDDETEFLKKDMTD